MSTTSRIDGAGGKIHSFWAMYSLRMSVCTVPDSRSRATPCCSPTHDVEREQHRRRRVDRHRRRHLAERDAREQRLHVGERVDRDPLAPDLAERARMIGVVAHQRRHVERRREPRLPVLEQIPEPLVRLGRRPEPRELAHRPQPAPIHGRVDAARERELPRIAEVAPVVDPDALRRVQRLVLDPRDGREQPRPPAPARRVALRARRPAPDSPRASGPSVIAMTLILGGGVDALCEETPGERLHFGLSRVANQGDPS